MRVYCAGPMRGYEGYNFPAFDQARDLLHSLGHDPVSPADMDRAVGVDGASEAPEGFVYDALRRDFEAICTCDAIALLPGWEGSSGARAERTVAEAIGLAVYRIDNRSFYREAFIGLSGYARAGKDTLAGFITQLGFTHRSFAAPMKRMLTALDPLVGHRRLSEELAVWGWEGAKQNPEVRRLAQRLGTTAGRKILGEDFWVETLLRSPSSGRVVVSDVRFTNEAVAIRARGGIVVRINRPGTGPVNGHVSETDLDGFDFDLTVDNDGSIEDLAPWARKVVEMTERSAGV